MWSKHKKDILEMDVIVKYIIYDTDNNYGQLIAFWSDGSSWRHTSNHNVP